MPHVNKLPGMLSFAALKYTTWKHAISVQTFFGVSTLIPVWDRSVYAGLTARQTQC